MPITDEELFWSGVEHWDIDTAETLLKILSPHARMWADEPSAWIFRGHAHAHWTLQPTALRSRDNFECFHNIGVTTAATTPGFDPTDGHPLWSLRAAYHQRMLDLFQKKLNRAGLPIPASIQPVIRGPIPTQHLAEPGPEQYPLMALAQHHGLPTMLLDWTRRAVVAVYFAAAEAAVRAKRDPNDDSCLALWALERGDLTRPAEGPYFYDAPQWTNRNLNAQDGLFTICMIGEDEPSLDVHLGRMKALTGGGPRLRRFVLKAQQAPKLLRLLSYESVTGASMFPGADGVVRAMRELSLWDRTPA